MTTTRLNLFHWTKGANDRFLFAEYHGNGLITLGARYENAAPDTNYQVVVNGDDLYNIGKMLIGMSEIIDTIERLGQ